MPDPSLPRVLADLPLGKSITQMLAGKVELLPWASAQEAGAGAISGIYTYGHPAVGPALLDCLPKVRVISNFGVTPSIPADSALTLALLDYREGNFEQSAVWCQRLLDYPECSAVQLANAQVIQALAYLKLGQSAQAKWQLARAGELIQKKLSLPMAQGNPTDGFWFDWVLVRELWQEASS